jgi:hypothetical protein
VKHGPAREEYEATWPVERSVALANRVLAAPAGLRRALLTRARTESAAAE